MPSGRSRLRNRVLVADRPAEVTDRILLGHWGADFVMGAHPTAVATLPPRTAPFEVTYPSDSEVGHPAHLMAGGTRSPSSSPGSSRGYPSSVTSTPRSWTRLSPPASQTSARFASGSGSSCSRRVASGDSVPSLAGREEVREPPRQRSLPVRRAARLGALRPKHNAKMLCTGPTATPGPGLSVLDSCGRSSAVPSPLPRSVCAHPPPRPQGPTDPGRNLRGRP